MAPKKIIGRVEFKDNLAGKNYLVRIVFDEKLDFVPGQYVSLKVNEAGMRRSYSVASLPGGKSIEVLVDVSPMGLGSKFILELKVGDEVEILGFLGRFIVDPSSLMEVKTLLFIATGTGVSPLRPMIEDLLYNKHFAGEVRLVWAMRHEEDLYWLKEMDNINRDFDNFKFDVVLSKPTEDWLGFKGHVGDVFKTLSQNWPQSLAYLCGAKEMISEMEKGLLAKGVPQNHIFYEKYF